MTAIINTEAAVARARQLLHTAADASKQLEGSVRELVTMRAWDVLGYKDFSEMWLKENGFKCPTHVQAVAVDALRNEGLNTRTGTNLRDNGPDGHTVVGVAKNVGLGTNWSGKGYETSAIASGMLTQLDHGVPPERVTKTGGSAPRAAAVIEQFGSTPYEPRRRGQPRRMGKTPAELVSLSANVPRRLDDEISEIARTADVPKAEIVRQALEEYAARHRESRPGVVSDRDL